MIKTNIRNHTANSSDDLDSTLLTNISLKILNVSSTEALFTYKYTAENNPIKLANMPTSEKEPPEKTLNMLLTNMIKANTAIQKITKSKLSVNYPLLYFKSTLNFLNFIEQTIIFFSTFPRF